MHKNDFSGFRGDTCGCREQPLSCPITERAQYVKCGCGAPEREPSWGLRGYPLASVYSPLQEWREIYDIENGLKRGTIFKELDLPFYGDGRGGSCNSGCGGGRNGR